MWCGADRVQLSYMKNILALLPVLSPPVLCGRRDNVHIREVNCPLMWHCNRATGSQNLIVHLNPPGGGLVKILSSGPQDLLNFWCSRSGMESDRICISHKSTLWEQWCALGSSKSPWSPLIYTKVKVYFLPSVNSSPGHLSLSDSVIKTVSFIPIVSA